MRVKKLWIITLGEALALEALQVLAETTIVLAHGGGIEHIDQRVAVAEQARAIDLLAQAWELDQTTQKAQIVHVNS